jgi:hypothetical protein
MTSEGEAEAGIEPADRALQSASPHTGATYRHMSLNLGAFCGVVESGDCYRIATRSPFPDVESNEAQLARVAAWARSGPVQARTGYGRSPQGPQ